AEPRQRRRPCRGGPRARCRRCRRPDRGGGTNRGGHCALPRAREPPRPRRHPHPRGCGLSPRHRHHPAMTSRPTLAARLRAAAALLVVLVAAVAAPAVLVRIGLPTLSAVRSAVSVRDLPPRLAAE